MSRDVAKERAAAVDAADRIAARRARLAPEDAHLEARAEMAEQLADVFGPDSVLIGQVTAGTFITPDRFDLVLALLGIDRPDTVVALQLQRHHQITVVRTRIEHRPGGPVMRLEREAVFIVPKETTDG